MELSDFGLDEKTMEEILTISALEVRGFSWPWNEDGTPKVGSVMDPRLERAFGHIALARPVKPIEMVRLQLPVDEITILPVPPHSIMEGKDLSRQLHEISMMNERLRELSGVLGGKGDTDGGLGEVCDMAHECLTYWLSTYLDNQLGEYWPSKRVPAYSSRVHMSRRNPALGIYQYCFPGDSSRKFNEDYKSERYVELEERFKKMNS